MALSSSSRTLHVAWAQQAALTAAALAAFVQQHAARKPAALVVVSPQPFVAAAAQMPAQQGPVCAAHAAAAVLKCLPYELPATAASVARLSGQGRLWAALGKPAALEQAQADLYGASIDAGTAARPLMEYGLAAARLPASVLPVSSVAASCTAISGAPCACSRAS